MAEPRTIRRLAFQMLYQLDAVNGEGAETMAQVLAGAEGLTVGELDRVSSLAVAAYEARATADAAVAELAPEWPVHRQPAVDRAILRLAYYEMTSGRTPAKAAISEAIKIAKEFSTEKSPSFINAILDKLYKRLPEPSATVPDPVEGES